MILEQEKIISPNFIKLGEGSRYPLILVSVACQNKCWIDGKRKVKKISSLSLKHLLNIRTFLLRGFFIKDDKKISIPKTIELYKYRFLKVINEEIFAKSIINKGTLKNAKCIRKLIKKNKGKK